MKMLISPITLEEARIVVDGGADIVDIKNVAEGSLGARPPWMIKEIVDEFADRDVVCSAALGDLPNKPGTVALASYGAAMTGAHYLKAGLYGATDYDTALAMTTAFVKGVRMVSDDILAVACGYADYRRFGGVSPIDIVKAGKEAGCNLVMVDTAIKDGKNLFDAMTETEIRQFIDASHEAGMQVALAGSVKAEHLEALAKLGSDIVGVRGAACDSDDRTKGISRERVEALVAQARGLRN